jgi:hypothetical protein
MAIEKMISAEIARDQTEEQEKELPDPEEIQQIRELYFSHFYSLINGLTKFDEKQENKLFYG